jgi:lipopolysaccharide transport system ATP-binding protein
MSAVISIDGLGKQYQLGLRAEKYLTLRDAITSAIKAPFQRLATMRGKGPEAGNFWALRNASFEVNRGEVVALIGRNGAGKSTLLKILSRIVEPTEGRARMKGRLASLLEVGTGFHPELTGRENIYLNGAILGMRKQEIDRKFDQIVSFAETEKFLDTPVKYYSSGMYVRLAFAVAAHLEPEILIVDEVLAVGDSEFQKKCLGRIQEVAQGDGRTVLFVSHNMGAVRRLCNRAVHLQNGTVVAVGPTEEIVNGYIKSGMEESEKDLRRRGRAFGMTPLLTSFSCVVPGGTERAVCGSKVIFEVGVDLPQTIKNATLGFTLSSEQGYRVLGFNTRLENGPQMFSAGRRTMRCTVDQLPLSPGRYTIDVGISSGERPMDYVEHAAILDVEFADFFNTGQTLLAHEGSVLHRSTWDI